MSAVRRMRLAGVGIAAVAASALPALGLMLGARPLAVDRAILLGLRRGDPSGRLLGIATDITALGSGPVLTLLVLLVAGWLSVRGRLRTALLLVGAGESVGQAVKLAKAIVARPRPALVPHWIAVDHFSYPSAHSADAATVGVLLALLVARAHPARPARVYVGAAATLVVGAIGWSRVYLAVHWPSDVLAGWSFGAAWALGWWRAVGPSGARE